MMNEEKQKALEAALGHIEKQYGKGSVMKLEIPVRAYADRGSSDRFSWSGYSTWSRRSAEGTYC